MTNEEAKFILRAYRSNGADANSPEFQEALRHAENDPTLHAWFERERRFDAEVTAKLKTIAPPPGLRSSILAGARAQKKSNVVRFTLWTSLAVAAGLAFAIVSRVFPSRNAFSPEAFATFASNDVLHGNHGGRGELIALVARQLSAEKPRLANGIPVAFDALKRDGCRMLSFNGREALELCAEANGAEYHLYVYQTDGRHPIDFITKDALAVATWSDGHLAYALVGKSKEAITRLL